MKDSKNILTNLDNMFPVCAQLNYKQGNNSYRNCYNKVEESKLKMPYFIASNSIIKFPRIHIFSFIFLNYVDTYIP